MRNDANILSLCARIRVAASRAGLLSVLAAAIGLSGLATSCDYGTLMMPWEEDYGTNEGTAVTISIRTKSTYGSNFNSQDVKYDDGSIYENYIDLSGEDYRVYFFTNSSATDGSDDTFIAEFTASAFSENDNGKYRTYFMRGTVPDLLLGESDFKAVVLANWGTYPDPIYGETTIADICTPTAATGTFQRTTSQVISPDNLIPFYGVQDYTGITFTPNETTTLPTEISLLRAMAKVEVLLTNNDLSLADVRICRYNDTGCCAPDGVYDGSYVTGSGWNVDGIHLVDDQNDEDQTDENEFANLRRLHCYNSVTAAAADPDNGVYETWVAYIPEYSNGGDDYCYIEIFFTDQENTLGTPDPFRVYFTDYDDDGKVPDDAEYYDIGRNILYRYTISYIDTFRVIPQHWEYTFDNDFTFHGMV